MKDNSGHSEPKLIKVTLEYDNGHKLVRSKDDALPFLIRLAKQLKTKKYEQLRTRIQ